MKYSEFHLDDRLMAAIEKMGYSETTPIQEQTIPYILQGKDVAGLAQTGTGKTAAFLIPLIERILKSETQPTHERAFPDWKSFQSILILVPTRELADQINDNIIRLTEGCGLKSFAFYGGTGYEKQKEALKGGLHFIVSTPGRLLDLYKEHFVDFKKVRCIIFDEADRMFDMGFKDDMKYILGRIERNRQFLVFSATLNFDVLNTAYQYGAEPIEINISRDQAKADNVKDAIFHLGNNEKPQHLLSLIKKENPKQVIIFTNFKNNVDRISQFLSANNIPSMGLSSLMNQSQRNNVISKFKEENNLNVLVATDVAARGLDINGVDLVINYELPQDCESYVHRIGRTGRAGNEGKAFSFVSDKDVDSLARIEDYTKKKIEVQYLEDADFVKDFKPMQNEDFSFRKSFSDRKGQPSQQQRGPKGPRPQRPPRSGGPGGDNTAAEARHKGKTLSPAQGSNQQPQGKKDFNPKNKGPHKRHHEGKPRHQQGNGQHSPRHAGRSQAPVAASAAGKKVYRTSGAASATAGSKIKAFLRRLFG